MPSASSTFWLSACIRLKPRWRTASDLAEMIELIDIGGPALIRAAAKNCRDVTVVVDADDYGQLLQHMRANDGATPADWRLRLAAKAFARTAAYDAAIAGWFSRTTGMEAARIFCSGRHSHWQAALWRKSSSEGGVLRLPGAAVHQLLRPVRRRARNCPTTTSPMPMRHLRALRTSIRRVSAACVIVKHANPCGAALAVSPLEAFRRALACDRTAPSAALSRSIVSSMRKRRAKSRSCFTEVVIAPDAGQTPWPPWPQKKPAPAASRRLSCQERLEVRTVSGGFLVQSPDRGSFDGPRHCAW